MDFNHYIFGMGLIYVHSLAVTKEVLVQFLAQAKELIFQQEQEKHELTHAFFSHFCRNTFTVL